MYYNLTHIYKNSAHIFYILYNPTPFAQYSRAVPTELGNNLEVSGKLGPKRCDIPHMHARRTHFYKQFTPKKPNIHSSLCEFQIRISACMFQSLMYVDPLLYIVRYILHCVDLFFFPKGRGGRVILLFARLGREGCVRRGLFSVFL